MTAFIEKLKHLNRRADAASPVKGWLYLLAVALSSLLIVLVPFMIRGTYTVWTDAAGDAATQGVTFLRHVKEEGWLKAVGSFDFYMGLGADYLTSFSFFSLFDPFNLVFFALPFGDLMNYTLTMALKHLACACTMFAYLKHRKVRNSRAIVLATAYMLTGFTAFTFVRHYNLTAGPIYLPLVLMGIEMILEGKRPYLFIASVFLTLVTNFYVFFSVTVFAVAYAIGYYFWSEQKASVKGFFARLLPVAGYYLVGVALGGIMLAPNAYGYLNAARSASKGVEIFAFDVFFTQALSLTLPISAQHYSSMGVNFALAIFAVYAVMKKKQSTRLHAWFTVVLLVGYLLPLFGYAMNIFNYSNNRWSYGFSFFTLSLIGLQSNEGEEVFEEGDIQKINRFFVIYLAVTLAAGLPALGATLGFSWWLVLLSVVVAGAIGFGAYKLIKSGWTWKALRKVYEPNFLNFVALVLVVVFCGGYYVVYSRQHDGKRKYGGLFSAEEKYVSTLNQTEYFRTDAGNPATWYDSFENRGVNNRYYGTKAYNSITNKYIYEFLKENGVYNPTQNLGISGLDERFALQSLLSVKYTFNPYGENYGFTKTDGFDALYENKNYLPFGFVFKESISRGTYDLLPVLERQYALLEGVVLEEGEGSISSFDGGMVELTSLPAGTVSKQSPVTVTAQVPAGHETYFVLENVEEVTRNTRINIMANGRTKQYYFAEKGDLMYSEQRTAYLSFGRADTQTEIVFTMEIEAGSEVRFGGVKVVALQTAGAESAISSLKAGGGMQGVRVGHNRIEGTVVSDGGYLLLTVPYSDGWTAFVDGEKTELLRADTAFCAVKVEAGSHAVRLEYETPLLPLGKKVSLFGAAATLVIVAAYETHRIIRKRKV